MASLKSLAKDTTIYGLSSIVGRFLNYLLVPLYTHAMPASEGGYGVVTNIYSIIALLMVILTCGLETGFFRFANKPEEDPKRVYSTTLLTVSFFSLSFLAVCLLFLKPIAGVMGYGNHPWYLGMMLIVLSMDVIQSIPFAWLRYQKRPLRFASLKLLFIVMSISLNMVYFLGMKGTGVGAVFVINLICTSIVMLVMIPQLRGFKYVWDSKLCKRLLHYSWPILVLGVAGICNQVADKIIFPFVYPDLATSAQQLGIYGATSKIAMIMAMLTQAFRYAYEPFVFSESKDGDKRDLYAKAMKYFIIFTLLAFLAVMFYMDVLRYLIGKDYWEGLKVVPIVMAAEMFMGIYFNLSFWYKLTDQTQWGAWFSLIACGLTVLVNILFIPHYGYMACAWGGFVGYGSAMLLSFFVGQKKYPIHYDLTAIGKYVALAAVLWGVSVLLPVDNIVLKLMLNTLLLLLFLGYIIKKDMPLSGWPFIGKYFRNR